MIVIFAVMTCGMVVFFFKFPTTIMLICNNYLEQAGAGLYLIVGCYFVVSYSLIR